MNQGKQMILVELSMKMKYFIPKLEKLYKEVCIMKKISRKTLKKVKNRIRRHERARKNRIGTPNKPRLAVYKSNNHIYAQLIDDINEKTLAAASTLKPKLKEKLEITSNKEAAKKVGEEIAKLAKKKKKVVFDTGGFKYHGRIAALADAARDKGLEF